jgi:hypothetical protein
MSIMIGGDLKQKILKEHLVLVSGNSRCKITQKTKAVRTPQCEPLFFYLSFIFSKNASFFLLATGILVPSCSTAKSPSE